MLIEAPARGVVVLDEAPDEDPPPIPARPTSARLLYDGVVALLARDRAAGGGDGTAASLGVLFEEKYECGARVLDGREAETEGRISGGSPNSGVAFGTALVCLAVGAGGGTPRPRP